MKLKKYEVLLCVIVRAHCGQLSYCFGSLLQKLNTLNILQNWQSEAAAWSLVLMVFCSALQLYNLQVLCNTFDGIIYQLTRFVRGKWTSCYCHRSHPCLLPVRHLVHTNQIKTACGTDLAHLDHLQAYNTTRAKTLLFFDLSRSNFL